MNSTKLTRPERLLALTLVAGTAGLFGCSSDAPTRPLHSYNERASGEITPAQPAPPVVIQNAFGPITITGDVSQNRIGWFLDKTLSGESQEAADGLFALVRLDSSSTGDTLVLTVNAPRDAGAVVGLSLSLPNSSPCVVWSVQGPTTVSFMHATLQTENSGTLSLAGHEGSCRLDADKGDLTLELALPAQGECLALVDEGDISLRVPHDTSANVILSAAGGLVTTSGLAIEPTIAYPDFLVGTMGGGEGQGLISLRTKKGSVTLSGF